MSQTETFLLPDGRKTSDLKVNELKKELEKFGKSKSGNKSELLNRLNESLIGTSKSTSQIEKEKSVSSESQIELRNSNENEIEDKTQNDRRIVNYKTNSGLSVDLDASDDNPLDSSEVNQSVDALDLYVPIDDSLNIADESIQEERIQVTISVNDKDGVKCNEEEDNENDNEERRVVETIKNDQRTVICNNNDSEKEEIIDMEYNNVTEDSGEKETRKVERLEEKCESRKVDTENEPDEMENIELETQIEMYEVDNIDMDSQLEIYEEHKEENLDNSDKKDDSIIANIEKDLRESEFLEVGANDETEEGEVVTVPITARLGKRKVKEDSKEYLSPKKSKKKGLKETKGTGYIIEGPERVEPAQKSKNTISDVLRIDNLVRPFTLMQLQDMLALQGSIKDIWLNKIKSVAYVRYETDTVANSARETIDGCRWPSINPKLLSCDFVCSKEMEWMKDKGDSGINPPPNFNRPPPPPSSQQQQQDQKDSSKPNTHKEQGQNQEPTSSSGGGGNKSGNIDNDWKPVEKPKSTNRESHQQQHHHQQQQQQSSSSTHHKSEKSSDDVKKRETRKEREIVPSGDNNNNNNNNSNKRRQQRSPHPDHHRRRHESPKEQRTKERERGERVPDKSKEAKHHHQQQQQQSQQQQQPPPPPPPAAAAAKLLEDIFRKTVTQPAIYWLPVAKDKKEEPIKKVKETVRVQ